MLNWHIFLGERKENFTMVNKHGLTQILNFFANQNKSKTEILFGTFFYFYFRTKSLCLETGSDGWVKYFSQFVPRNTISQFILLLLEIEGGGWPSHDWYLATLSRYVVANTNLGDLKGRVYMRSLNIVWLYKNTSRQYPYVHFTLYI